MSEIKFKRDTIFRKQFFVPDSFAHPAKMDAQLLIWITEKYSKVGETILDPMAGSGTMMLACGLGRNVILVELEEKFCKMMRDNWEEVRMRPQLGYEMGECQIILGDARNLEGLLVDKIITSLPYAESVHKGSGEWSQSPNGKMVGVPQGEDYTKSDKNISNLSYGNIDAVITSPPYEEAMGEKHHSPRADKLAKEKSNPVTYTDKVDAVITSPPYESAITGKEAGIDWSKGTRGKAEGNKPRDKSKEPAFGHLAGFGMPLGYSESKDNIGNLKSQSYLEAMLLVYQQCFTVLKSGGLLILVTKNFIRNKQVIRLDEDTKKLCEQAGFKYLERYYRKLSAQSFWRVIYHQRHPEVEQINYEDVIVFAK